MKKVYSIYKANTYINISQGGLLLSNLVGKDKFARIVKHNGRFFPSMLLG